MFRNSIIVIFLTTLITAPVNAQWNLNFGTYSTIDNNVFRNYYQNSDTYQNFNIYLSRDIPLNNLNIRGYYDGSKTFYNTFTNRNYSLNSGGLVFTKALKNQKYILNFGGNTSYINYNESYKIFNSKNFKAFNNIRYSNNNTIYITGITAEYSQYPNLNSQNSIETDVFLRWQKSYESRTSLKTKVSYGHQNYFNKSTFVGDELVFENKSDFANRISFEFNAAQSITDLFGASINFEYSRPIKSPERYLRINSDYIFSEEDIFNDPFDYKLDNISAQLSKIFKNNISAQIAGSLQSRNYINQMAIDLEGNFIYPGILREDVRKSIIFNIKKNFDISKMAVRSFTVGFSLLWLSNESNDPYYDYNNLLTNFNFSFSLL